MTKKIDFAPVRAITHGPAHHWFAYYDKLAFDVDNRYVLGMAVEFEDRAPDGDEVIRVGMVDLHDGDRWIDLGESRAWGWQQGCMLQWRPESATEVMWNDRDDDHFVCRILDVDTGKQRTIQRAIYTVSPDGQTGLSLDFERVQDMRPGYGYPGVPDPNADLLRPLDAGIYAVDLESGDNRLILSIADIAAIPFAHADLSKAKHYVNHLLINPDGSRFVFLHRWREPDSSRYADVGGFGTRMMTANLDGSDLRVIDDSGYTSHFIWRDPGHILAWTRLADGGDGFYLFEDSDTPTGVLAVGKSKMTRNGHCTYMPDGDWILNDTYPDEKRMQDVYLYHPKDDRIIPLGRFHAPPDYIGELRVDTHPRASRDGRLVAIDSAHGGQGRQIYLIDSSSYLQTEAKL